MKIEGYVYMNNTTFSSPPLISVVVTTYNRRLMLQDAISSILDQTYLNYEIIVVNDCGEDVWDVIELFESDKIKYISHIKNFGQPSARNTAIKAANGDIICYLDDDDLFLDNHFELIVDIYMTHNVDVVYTDALLLTENIKNNNRIVLERKNMFNISKYTYQQLLIQNYIPINTLSHKKAILSEVGVFKEELSSLEDWEFLLRLGKNKDFYHINQSTVEVRRNINSIDTVSIKGQIDAPSMYKKIYYLHKVNEDYDLEAQRSLVILRIIKDNIIIKKSLGFTVSQLYPILKEISRFIYYSLLSILKSKRQKND